MSRLRPGSSQAKELFEASIEASQSRWIDNLRDYPRAIMILDQLKQGRLQALDHFWRHEYPQILRSRSPSYLELADLSRIMQWKLCRGKARPLQALVDSNSSSLVVEVSKQAFELIQQDGDNWKAAFDQLVKLKGVGEATASAILAPIAPESCPFMADEVIDATCPKRDYTRKTYNILRDAAIAKANSLNAIQSEHHWTAEDVGKALWTRAILAAYDDQYSSAKREADIVDSKAAKKARCV
jgi:hypothetical protein